MADYNNSVFAGPGQNVIVATTSSGQLASLAPGTTTTVLHGNAIGLPSYGAVSLTADVSGTLPSGNGGTNNAFTAFSGPASSTKTFTLPNASDTIVCLGTATTFTKQQVFGVATLTDASTVAWDVSGAQAARVTLGGNRTLGNQTNSINGGTYTLVVIQDGTGSRTLAYASNYKWPGGSAPTLSTAAGAIDVLTFLCDNGLMLGVAQKAFA